MGREGTGDGCPCSHIGAQEQWGKLRTQGASGVHIQGPGEKQWVCLAYGQVPYKPSLY